MVGKTYLLEISLRNERRIVRTPKIHPELYCAKRRRNNSPEFMDCSSPLGETPEELQQELFEKIVDINNVQQSVDIWNLILRYKSALNGNNGEVSNKDDVKKTQIVQKKKQGKKTTVTVTQKVRQPRAKGLRRIGRMSQVPLKRTSLDELKLVTAWENPFAPEAENCRILDGLPFPTTCRVIKGDIQCVSSSAGIFSAAFIPHPYFICQLGAGNINGDISPYILYNTNSYYAAAPADLQQQLSTYRVVAAGWRVKNSMNYSNLQGAYHYAPLAGTDSRLLTVEGLNGFAYTQNQLMSCLCGAYSSNSLFSTKIMQLPFAQEFQANALVENVYDMVAHPTSPVAYGFHSALPYTAGATNTIVEDTAYTAAGVVTQGGGANVVSTTGMPVFVIYANNLPVSTLVCEIEYIIHLEGTPQVQIGSSNIGLPGGAIAVAPPGTMDKIQTAAQMAPFSRLVANGIQTVGQGLFGDNSLGAMARGAASLYGGPLVAGAMGIGMAMYGRGRKFKVS